MEFSNYYSTESLYTPGQVTSWMDSNLLPSNKRYHVPSSNQVPFQTNWRDCSAFDGIGKHFFRFQLGNAQSITCPSCSKCFLINQIGITHDYCPPNKIVCSNCREIIINKDMEGCSSNLEQPTLFDLERLLINHGRHLASSSTLLMFMKIKQPPSYYQWNLVLVCLTNRSLRLFDTHQAIVAQFDLSSLTLKSTSTSEMSIHDSKGTPIFFNTGTPKAMRWFKAQVAAKVRNAHSVLEKHLSALEPHPTHPIIETEKKTKTGLFSKIRLGKFLKKKPSLMTSLPDPVEITHDEAMVPLSKKSKLHLTFHRLSARSTPNMVLSTPNFYNTHIPTTRTISTTRTSSSTISSTTADHHHLPTSTSTTHLDFLFSSPYEPSPQTFHSLGHRKLSPTPGHVEDSPTLPFPDMLSLLDQFPIPPPRQSIFMSSPTAATSL